MVDTMSSSVFSVNDNTGDSGSSFSNLLPVNVISEDGIHESVMLDANGLPSLPGLDEFCQNNDHVNAIYNMLGHSSNSELCVEHHSNNENQEFRPSNHGHNEDTIFQINQSNNHCPSTSNNQDYPSSNHDSSTSTPSLSFQIRIGEPEEGTSGPEPPLGTVIRRGISVIGQDQLMATPSTSQNYEGVTSEPNRVVNGVVPHAPEMLHSEDPNEEEIDEVFQNVFSCYSQAAEKEILVMLDADTLKHCLDHLRKSPLHICSFCYELFQDISPFQVHIQTCCSPPGVEVKQKMDQAANAMDQLARSLWKSVFLKELQNTPIGQNLKQHEGHLHNELNQIWLSGSFEPMLKCREIFIRAAVAIVSRRWVTNAVANELHRVRAIKPKQPKKRVKIDSDTDQSVADPNSSKSENHLYRRRERLVACGSNKNAKKTTETDLAIRGLINDQDETSSNTTQYHFTPETPVSDHGIDVMPVLPPSVDATEQSRLTNSREDSVTTPISDSGVDFTPEMDYELDRLVRGVPDVDLLAEAAKGFENLDNASDAWENNTTADEPLSENEFVVGKILDRRLLYKVEEAQGVWKAIRRGPNMLFVVSNSKESSRKFRIRFQPNNQEEPTTVAYACACYLSRFFTLHDADRQGQDDDHPPSCTISIEQLSIAVLDPQNSKWPSDYADIGESPELVPDLLRSCLMDPNFPALVEAVESSLKKLMNSDNSS